MIALFIVLLLLLLLLEYASRRRNLDSLTAELSFSEHLVQPDEETKMVLTLTNHTRSFFPFLRVEVILPDGLEAQAPDNQLTKDGRGRMTLSFTAWLSRGQSVSQRYPVTADARGRYLLQKVTIFSGDFLGLYTQEKSQSLYRELVVMPKEAPREEISQILGGTLGDISVRRFLYEDPVLTVGCREYTSRDPLKSISWTQTARQGKLMVKQYDYTTEASACVILDGTCGQKEERGSLEQCFSLVRMICAQLEEMRIPYAFYTNVLTAGEFDTFRSVSKGLGSGHFLHIMEGLGRALPETRESCEGLLIRASSDADENRSFLFVTQKKDPETLRMADFWAEKAGGRLFAFIGEEADYADADRMEASG